MEVIFKEDGGLEINGATVLFKHFSGIADQYNRDGDRNFEILIPDEELANALANDLNEYGVGWGVRLKESTSEEYPDYWKMKIKVKFNARGPYIYIKSGNKVEGPLTEDTVKRLDEIIIDHVDLDVNPRDSITPSGKPARTAWLQDMMVYQRVSDRFAHMVGLDDRE